MSKDYRPRLSIEITPELQKRLQDLFPWGTQKHIFNVILEDLVSMAEEHGANLVIYLFAERKLTLEKMCKLEIPKEDEE